MNLFQWFKNRKLKKLQEKEVQKAYREKYDFISYLNDVSYFKEVGQRTEEVDILEEAKKQYWDTYRDAIPMYDTITGEKFDWYSIAKREVTFDSKTGEPILGNITVQVFRFKFILKKQRTAYENDHERVQVFFSPDRG